MPVLFQYHNLIFSALSELPAFLVKDGGLNSGFMLAHCTAAALGIFDQYLNYLFPKRQNSYYQLYPGTCK